MSLAPSIDWSHARYTEPGPALHVPVTSVTPEWTAAFKHALSVRAHAARQDPWGHIGLIGDVIVVPSVSAGAEALLRQTLDELVTSAQRRAAAAPKPESPESMLELLRSLSA